MEKQTFVLVHDTARQRALQAVKDASDGMVVQIKLPTRSLAQNALLWPLLEDVASQVEWYGQWLTKEDWKDLFTAALRKQRAVPGIEGGFVVMGERTSQYTKQEFSDLIELIYSFGAERNVKFRTDDE